MELNNRLIILRDSGQIDEEIYDKTLSIISLFKHKWNIGLTEENGAMLITHLCIALQRVKNNCPAEKNDEELYKEVKLNQHFEICEKAFNDIMEEINMDITESEKSFLMMHLCVLFEKENILESKGELI